MSYLEKEKIQNQMNTLKFKFYECGKKQLANGGFKLTWRSLILQFLAVILSSDLPGFVLEGQTKTAEAQNRGEGRILGKKEGSQ